MKLFDDEKTFVLSKKDKSRIGKIDIQIKPVVDKINSLKDYFTTSSCAGRIVLIEFGKRKKVDSNWLLVSHKKVTFKQIKEGLSKVSKREVWLNQESWILHICCRDIESGEKLLKICRSLGLKRSGIVSANKKIMVEIMSNESMSLPISEAGKVLVDDTFVRFLIKKANKGLIKTRIRLARFKKQLNLN